MQIWRFFFYLSFILLYGASGLDAQNGGTIINGEAKIFYRIYGKGLPVLIINGGPGMNSDGFVPLAKKLSANHQIILYDQRGTGKSMLNPVNETTVTMQGMLNDLEVLRKQLGIEQWTILGHSFGGMLASYYAARYPEHVRSLILSSSGGIDLGLESYIGHSIQDRLTKSEKDSLAFWNKKIAAGDTSYAARLGRGRALAPAYVYDKKYAPVIAERLTQGNAAITALVWQNMDKIKFDCAPQLKNFNKPVLIIQGREDIVELKTAKKAQAVFKNSKLVVMEHCVHYGWLDNPELYFREVNAFLLMN